MREFIFKFYRNILGLNTRVHHFNANTPRTCTFCVISRERNPADETFSHLFFECKHTANLRTTFNVRYLLELNLDNERKNKSFYFFGIDPNTEKNDNLFLASVSKQFMFFFWRSKLKKNLPLLNGLLNELFYNLETIRRLNSKFREHMVLNLSICRLWNAVVSSRHQ
jgi:hypothetical protein